MEIEKLNELECLELLQMIGDHIRKNNMEHLIDQVFVVDDHEAELHDLKQQIEDLEKEKSELENDHIVLSAKIDESISKIKVWMEDQGGIIQELLDTLE